MGNSGKGKHTWLSGLLKCAKCGYSLSVVADKSYRYLACSGRYNKNRCDAAIHVKLAELEAVVQTEIEKLLTQCPQEPVVPKLEEDSYTQRLLELDRRALAQFGTGPLGQFKQNWSVERLDTRVAKEDGPTG